MKRQKTDTGTPGAGQAVNFKERWIIEAGFSKANQPPRRTRFD